MTRREESVPARPVDAALPEGQRVSSAPERKAWMPATSRQRAARRRSSPRNESA